MKKYIGGLLPGALAGLVYGLVEYSVIVLRPLVQWRPAAIPPEHWQWETAFLAVYMFFGAMIGGIAALFRKSPTGPGRRSTVIAGLAAAAAAVLIACTAWFNAAPPLRARKTAFAANPGRPNILLIVLDTVRADHLSLYGYDRRTTPHLEEMARESVCYRNAVSAADVTLSSHASMFTGLYPSWHGAYPTPGNDLGRLDSSFHTLAEILSENGYGTFAVLANFGYLRPEFGMAQGFAYYDVRSPVQTLPAAASYFPRALVRSAFDSIVSTAELDRIYRRADQITDGALHVLDSRDARSGPFFLSLNYMDAHEPYSPPAPYRDLFPGRDPHFDNGRIGTLRRQLATHHRPADADGTLRHIVSQYDGAIAYMDSELNRLFEAMKRAGVYENTLIVVTSDHGEALGERDDLGHPASVHRELVHVPLIVKYPRAVQAPAGQWIETPVSGVDLLPTVLETAGIPVPENVQGQSLRRPMDPGRVIIAESFLDDHLRRLHRRTDLVQRALYQGRWKLIGSTSGKRELYDVAADPSESRDLFNPDEAASQECSATLDRWVRIIPARRITPRMDQQTKARLKSLGYIQ
jgi:arylsulfatase A-like enzyme